VICKYAVAISITNYILYDINDIRPIICFSFNYYGCRWVYFRDMLGYHLFRSSVVATVSATLSLLDTLNAKPLHLRELYNIKRSSTAIRGVKN